MATHFSTLAWKTPWAEEPGRLQSMGSWRVGHDWATSLWLFTFMHWRRKWQPTPVFLPRESQGWGSLVGCRLWGRRVGHDWSNLAAAARTYVVHSQPFLIPCDPMDCSPPGSSVHGISQGRILNGCHALLEGIFPTQGSNLRLLCLLHWHTDSLPLSHLGSLRG